MSSINRWMNFFNDAGIQNESAASYAKNFYENKMDMSMLLDLDKEYLNDLGVYQLGDVIKVKKHARKVAEKISTDKILNENSPQEKETESIVKTKKLKMKAEPEEDCQTYAEVPISNTIKRKTPKIKYEQTEVKSETVKSEPPVKSMASRLGPQQDNDQQPEDTKSSIFKRLGSTETESKPVKKNVFDRLEPIKTDPESLDVDSTKPSTRLVTSSKPRMVTTSGPQSAAGTGRTLIKTQVKDEPPRSAFDRLDSKHDSTQVPKVSSSNEASTSSPDPANPNKGILKQRRALVKSKSTSSIISLKARTTTPDNTKPDEKKRAIRVSFGSNDYRAVSPRQGIKTRLWKGAAPESDGGTIVDSSDEEELKDVHFSKKMQSAKVDDLRQNIKKKQEAKFKDDTPNKKSEESEKQPQLTFKVTNSALTKGPVKSDVIDDDVVPTKKVNKKIFVIQTLSNGEKIKKEISPNDPLYRKYQNEAIASKRSKVQGKPAVDSTPVAPKVSTQQVSVRLPSSKGISGNSLSSRMDEQVKEVRRLKIVDDDVDSKIDTSADRKESVMRMDEEVSRLNIHNVGAHRESYTLEARAARVSAEREDISLRVSNPSALNRSADLRNQMRGATSGGEDGVRIRYQDADIDGGRRFVKDDVDEEIARKEQSIYILENRISQSSKLLNKSTSAPSLSLQRHASPDVSRRDKPLRYDKAVDSVTGSRSRGGTMMADREGNQRPAIEDRLAAPPRANHRDKTRSRSRSPIDKISGSMMSRLGNGDGMRGARNGDSVREARNGDGMREARNGDGVRGARNGDGMLGARNGDGMRGARNGDVSSRSRRNETSHYKSSLGASSDVRARLGR